jgi:hypothetical protein
LRFARLQVWRTIGTLKTLALLRRYNTLEQQLQSRPVHLASAHRRPVADKRPCLETLRPHAKTRAIEVKNFYLNRAPRNEHKKIPAQRILAQLLTGERVQAVE